MSDVIDVLERISRDARWSHACEDDIKGLLAETVLDPELQAVIAAGDQRCLEALLGLSPLCGMLLPGKEDEKEDEDTEELPPGDDEDKPERSVLHLQVLAK